jgi:mycothiol system anti-sigma-R factor
MTDGVRIDRDPEDEVNEDPADCEETIYRLYHFLDGELTEERRQAIRSHLDGCGDCFDALGFEAELRRVIADRCKDRVPASLRERIAEAIHHEQQAKR